LEGQDCDIPVGDSAENDNYEEQVKSADEK